MTGALAALAALIQRTTGMTVPPGRETALRLAVGRAAPGLEPEDYLLATRDPAYGPGLIDRLIDEVTVHETSFARDMPQLRTIDWRALHRAARAAGSEVIRVWSAGCATGEEAYTLALLAISAFTPGAPPVDILGTDISGAVIAAAETGCYRPRAVRALDSATAQPPPGTAVRRHLRRLRPAAHAGPVRQAQPDPRPVPAAR